MGLALPGTLPDVLVDCLLLEAGLLGASRNVVTAV